MVGEACIFAGIWPTSPTGINGAANTASAAPQQHCFCLYRCSGGKKKDCMGAQTQMTKPPVANQRRNALSECQRRWRRKLEFTSSGANLKNHPTLVADAATSALQRRHLACMWWPFKRQNAFFTKSGPHAILLAGCIKSTP